MRFAIMTVVLAGIAVPAMAHHPDREHQHVTPRVDVIGPVGNRFGPSYRWRYNRPTYLGGKIMYKIAPTSQEAMAWHMAEHRCDYDCDHGRIVNHYFYAKPYDSLLIGGRKSRTQQDSDESAPDLTGLVGNDDDDSDQATDAGDDELDNDQMIESDDLELETPTEVDLSEPALSDLLELNPR